MSSFFLFARLFPRRLVCNRARSSATPCVEPPANTATFSECGYEYFLLRCDVFDLERNNVSSFLFIYFSLSQSFAKTSNAHCHYLLLAFNFETEAKWHPIIGKAASKVKIPLLSSSLVKKSPAKPR